MKNQSIEKVKGLVRVFTFACILHLLTLVPSALAEEHNCGKYCFESCSDYFNGPEFSPCVSANVHCNCITSKFSIKNPLVVFFLIFAIMVSCCCCCGCYRYHVRSNAPLRNTVVAQPIVSTTSSTLNGSSYDHLSPTRSYNNAIVASPVLPSAPVQTPYNQYPYPRNEIPPEYANPPAYNDCVIGINVQSEKT